MGEPRRDEMEEREETRRRNERLTSRTMTKDKRASERIKGSDLRDKKGPKTSRSVSLVFVRSSSHQITNPHPPSKTFAPKTLTTQQHHHHRISLSHPVPVSILS